MLITVATSGPSCLWFSPHPFSSGRWRVSEQENKVWAHTARVVSQLYHFPSCVTWETQRMGCFISHPQFPHLFPGDSNSTYLKMLWGLNEFIQVRCLEQCPVHSKYWVCVGCNYLWNHTRLNINPVRAGTWFCSLLCPQHLEAVLVYNICSGRAPGMEYIGINVYWIKTNVGGAPARLSR